MFLPVRANLEYILCNEGLCRYVTFNSFLGGLFINREYDIDLPKQPIIQFKPVDPKIQQTKMLVTCQRFGDWFLFGLVWPYSSNQKNIMKVGSKSLLLTCSSNKL